MNVSEIREMSVEAILDAIEDRKEAMFNFRFQLASGQLEDTNLPRRTRREIAQLKTVLRERELAAALLRQEGGENG
ncbi:MAG: 50S ribosomal protein L29 [Anaerolineae bacterium]|nr:50S ribosomal protein L29 [Anaerolineae bacterium]